MMDAALNLLALAVGFVLGHAMATDNREDDR